MKIILFGSTGETGKAIIRQAVSRGHEVYAFARDPDKIGFEHPRLHGIQGDVLDRGAVARAVEGTEAAISALGVRQGQPESTARSQGTRNIVDALERSAVSRFVSVSTVGAGDHLRSLPLLARILLPRIIGAWRLREAGLQEEAIRSSALDWTVLRPPRLVDGQGSGEYQIGETLAPGFGGKLTRENLATALLDQLSSREFLRRLPTVSD